MRIKSLKIKNYKSFVESDTVEFFEGFNFIIGQNGSGKTALIDALRFRIEDIRHLSSKTVPFIGMLNPNPPEAEIVITLNQMDIDVFLSKRGSINFVSADEVGKNYEQYFNKLVKNGDIEIVSDITPGTIKVKNIVSIYKNKTGYSYMEEPDDSIAINFLNIQTHGAGFKGFLSTVSSYRSVDFTQTFLNDSMESVYVFDAKRFATDKSPNGDTNTLNSDAGNLAQVMFYLMGNDPVMFERIVQNIRLMFPSIKQMRVRPHGSNEVEIVVWHEEEDSQRPDLAIPMRFGGAGLGQALSILYITLTSRLPKVIVIDEINNFLHPGATRHLMRILQSHPIHQYIITTHSPEVVNAVDNSSINIVKWEGGGSKVISVNPKEVNDTRLLYREVGARFSDLFGIDNVLWVEGQTEELCFGLILQKLVKTINKVVIVGVSATSEFEKKGKVKLIADIYEKLTTANALAPTPVGFLFDREKKTDQEIADLEKIGKGKIRFIPRRLYENYLIDPASIAKSINDIEGFSNETYSEDEIRTWLIANGCKKKYFKGVTFIEAVLSEDWLKFVDGANILGDLYRELSENRVEYIKTKHSVILTTIIMEHNPQILDEIANVLNALISEQIH